MPTGDGSAGTCLSTNGAGVLAWASCSSGGTGLTSLNGQTGATQSFADVDDTNVTLTIGSAADVHTFTMGWAGTLANTRGGTGQNTSAWSALPLVTAGTWSQYAGTGACGAGTAITALSASGVATCSALGAGNVSTGVTLTAGQLVIGAGTTNIAVGDLSGDVTTSGGTATALSLTGVGAGTYGQVTVDTKGRVSSASIIADVPHGGTGVATLTGLVFGNGAAAFSAYAGTGACPAGQSISALSGSGVATCTPAGAGDVIASGTLTANRLILGAGTTTVVAAASLGTTTTVLHGNAGGAPSFASVVDADLSGQVQVPHGGTGLASGSQGGVPYFATSTTMASSATLVNHAVVVGGGPGAPRTIGTGTAGQVLISQGASVDPIWSAATGCIVAGSTGQIQFNSAGNCGADSNLFWDNSAKRLGLGTATPSTQLQMTGDLTALGLDRGMPRRLASS